LTINLAIVADEQVAIALDESIDYDADMLRYFGEFGRVKRVLQVLNLVQSDHIKNFLAALLNVAQFDQENFLDVDTSVDKEMN
jgi:hypothetical protein